MRYYRLWIYTCNTVLFLSVLVFLVTSTYFFSDNRRMLFTSVRFYQPSFLYAYVALIMQGGVIQVIGCVAVLRLNERLLNAYWLILLGLLVGDVVVGGYWLTRYAGIAAGLGDDLRGRFAAEYRDGDSEFRRLWDGLQEDNRCCGVDGPLDFNATWWQQRQHREFASAKPSSADLQFKLEEEVFLPWSCCLSESRYSPKNLENRISSDGSGGGPVAQANTIRWRLEEKKRLEKEEEEDERRRAAEEEDRRRKERERTRNPGPFSPEVMVAEGPVLLEDSWCRFSNSGRADWHHHEGCRGPVRDWLHATADSLFVIGFCVIGFLKFTFIGLLRIEIKEMIQKIRVLKNEDQIEYFTAIGFPAAEQAVAAAANGDHMKPLHRDDNDEDEARGPMDSTASRSLLASVEAGNMVKQTAVTVKAEANRTANHTTAFRNDDACDTSSCSALITNSAQSTPFHHVYQNHVVADNPAAAAAVVAASASGAANSSDAVPNSVPNAIVSSSSVAAPAAAAKPNNYSIHMNSIDFSNEDLELTDVCRAALGGSSPASTFVGGSSVQTAI